MESEISGLYELSFTFKYISFTLEWFEYQWHINAGDN